MTCGALMDAAMLVLTGWHVIVEVVCSTVSIKFAGVVIIFCNVQSDDPTSACCE